MKKIGILFGMENTFPGALVDRINAFDLPDVRGIRASGRRQMAEPCRYAVVVDRISHDVPFYRAWLKNCALDGSYIINNPFWCSADDKFFNYAVAAKLGVAIPRTAVLPHKEHPTGDDRSVDAQPAVPDRLGRRLRVHRVSRISQAVRRRRLARRASRQLARGVLWRLRPDPHLCMTLQAAVNFTEYFRCYVVGQEVVHIMPYDPRAPFHERYIKHPPPYDPALLKRVERIPGRICRALGYDLNTVEFAVEDGVPYAIDFMNPAPDADLHSVGPDNFDWVVGRMAELAVKRALEPRPEMIYRWDRFLAGRL
jgi:hypothetical protein